MSDQNNNFIKDRLITLAIGTVAIIFVFGSMSLINFYLSKKFPPEEKPPIVSPTASPTATPTPTLAPSEFPDYDSRKNLKFLTIKTDFESWTPNTNLENNKVINTLIIENGSISKGYLYIKTSLRGKDTVDWKDATPLTQWESVYVKMNNWGGHLFRPQSLKVPPSDKTELLFAINDVPYLSTLPYSENRIPLRADWSKFFWNKSQISIVSFISSLKPARIEEMILYYECANNEDCNIVLKNK